MRPADGIVSPAPPGDGPQRAQGALRPEPELDHGSDGDGTVGGLKTVPPTGSEAATQWQEGLLVADRFRIVRFIGQGGMGQVYLAQDETLARPIALKRVPQEIIFDADARDDLRQEANRLLDLAHEHIVRIHTFYDGPTWPFFAMEYLQGPTLKKLLRTRRQYGRAFLPAEVIAVARQVAHGLAYAHAKGIIHRDLKPANLMLAAPPADEIGPSDVVKITDFGISRVIADSTMRHTGKRTGTLPYMSPEQFHGDPCSVQSDIYSIACTLYELSSGNPPFHSGDLGYQIVHVPPKPLNGVPRVLGDAILRGLAKDPRRRFQSVDEFAQALEGKVRVSRPHVQWKRYPLLAKCTGVLIALFVLLLLILQLLSTKRPTTSLERPEVAVVGPKANQEEKAEFAKRLREELYKQIPPLVGLNYPTTVPAAPGTISLTFSVAEPMSSIYQRRLFQGLFLQYHSQDPKAEKPYIAGTVKDGKKVFSLASLKEGSYTLRAYVEELREATRSFEPLLEDDPLKFTVDLTAPSLEIEPLNQSVFVTAELPLLTTFHETVDCQLRSLGGADDIVEAYYQIVYGGVVHPYEKLENPRLARLVLPPGVTTAYRVYAVDAAKNKSASKEITVRRLNLEVESFELASGDAVAGNLAKVKGVLRVEGDQRPHLRYFVNGSPVQPEPASGEGDGLVQPAGSLSGLTGIPFAAMLVLPEPTNTVDVRYSWNGNAPQRFARPVQISDVKVRVPSIRLSDFPTCTSKTRLQLEGRVEPIFDDLEVYLDQVGHGNSKLQLTRIAAVPPAATFSQEIELVPDEENRFRMLCFYRKNRLQDSPAVFSILCDTTPPRLADKVKFEATENRLSLLIFPLDELGQLRVREVVGTQPTQWKPAELDPTSLAYRYTTRLPQSPIIFQLELTDAAGNVAIVDESYSPAGVESTVEFARSNGPGRSDSPQPRPAIETRKDGSRPGPRSIVRLPGVAWIVSPFLEELGMDFVPFGSDRYEMCRIEVPERAWLGFLREKKGSASANPGRVDLPMTLKDHSPDLLREFVQWFEEKSADGYAYEIPTMDQWLRAFTGAGGSAAAVEMIRTWFRGELKDSTSSFNASPRERFGTNTILPIGSRPDVRTPTGLLDMVANVQEVVLDGQELKVIGGSNRDADARQLEENCVRARTFDVDAQTFQGSVTGLRLCRRPRPAK